MTRVDSDRESIGKWGECGRFLVAASVRTTSKLAAKKVGPATESPSSVGVHTGEQALVAEAVEEDVLVVATTVAVMTVEVQTAEVLVDPKTSRRIVALLALLHTKSPSSTKPYP